LKKRVFQWPIFLLELVVLVFAAATVVVMRKGYPVEISKVHLGRAMIEKSVFLTCVVLLGFIENASIRKRNR
jgi:hypothetical protein